MKEYLCARIDLPGTMVDTAIAYLSLFPFEGITEEEDHLLAYIPASSISKDEKEELHKLLEMVHAQCTWSKVANINWNQSWESSFKPIIIEGKCLVRANFHPKDPSIPYEILIDPKMAFGTGHHATTYLVLSYIFDHQFNQKSVLDYGCGTGILSIGAYYMGARMIHAIDIDENAIENTELNTKLNNTRIELLKKGDLDILPEGSYDYILANINKHVICNNIRSLYKLLNPSGIIVISGILAEHKESLLSLLTDTQLQVDAVEQRDGWLMFVCSK